MSYVPFHFFAVVVVVGINSIFLSHTSSQCFWCGKFLNHCQSILQPQISYFTNTIQIKRNFNLDKVFFARKLLVFAVYSEILCHLKNSKFDQTKKKELWERRVWNETNEKIFGVFLRVAFLNEISFLVSASVGWNRSNCRLSFFITSNELPIMYRRTWHTKRKDWKD